MANIKQTFLHKQSILRANPEKSQVEVHAKSQLVEAFRSQVKIRDFDVVVDQPEDMGSTNQGPRPSEYVLAALAACHEVTYRLYAEAMDIDLKAISVSVTGLSDAKGFFNLDDDTPAGFSEVYGEIDIESDASNDDIDRLRVAVNRHCPVLDDLRKPMKVELALKLRGRNMPQEEAEKA